MSSMPAPVAVRRIIPTLPGLVTPSSRNTLVGRLPRVRTKSASGVIRGASTSATTPWSCLPLPASHFTSDAVARSTGVPGLKKVYGVTFGDFVELDAGGPLTLNALVDGRVDAGNLFTTDPNISAKHLVPLEDPKFLFAAQNVVPLIRTDALTDTVKTTLNAVSAKLDTATLGDLVTQVVVDKEDPADVADKFLSDQGLN